MKYFFILGSNPTLSLAELSAVFALDKTPGQEPILAGRQNVLVLDINENINATELIKKLGGTIKIGQIDAESKFEEKACLSVLKNLTNSVAPAGKFKFGISYYGDKKLNTKVLGMELKKYLKEQDINSRWVTGREPELSSVIVEQNKLTSTGKEFVLLQSNNTLLVGFTLAVQPFKELSFRDYGRPARDDLSGMLPPKLAQIMINLTTVSRLANDRRHAKGVSLHQDVTLLDPFCGSGTILTEAMLMGYTNLIGSDISTKAIEDTRKNIEWILENYKLQISNYKLFNKGVGELPNILEQNSIDAIITEPFLGPQRGKFDINKTVKELEKLYCNSLKIFKNLLKPNGRIVMVWPVFRETHNAQRVSPNLNGFRIITPLSEQFLSYKNIRLTDRNTIIYGRPDQKVWREIVILQ